MLASKYFIHNALLAFRFHVMVWDLKCMNASKIQNIVVLVNVSEFVAPLENMGNSLSNVMQMLLYLLIINNIESLNFRCVSQGMHCIQYNLHGYLFE